MQFFPFYCYERWIELLVSNSDHLGKIKGLTDSWRVSVQTSCAAIPNGNFRMLSYRKDEWNTEWKRWQSAINPSHLLSR